jgi:YHS domain-containing protein
MTRAQHRCAAVAILLLAMTLPAAAAEGEFDNECVMGLALGKDIKTDCSINTVYEGKTYCFGNETAKSLFLKRPDEFLLKAQVYHSSKQQ